VFFSFVYPQKRHCVPAHVMNTLLERAKKEHCAENSEVCRGTLLSREQYLVDLKERGYSDARVAPYGNISKEDVAIWTDAIGQTK
jgi:hypothetical protein